MRKGMIGVVAAMFIVGAPVTHAQQASSGPGDTPESGRLSQAEFKMLTDIRVGVIKAALQLTPEQEKLWPAVEEAIRARAETRSRRLAALGERMDQQRDVDPVQLYRQRADVLADRAAGPEEARRCLAAALPEPYARPEDAATARDGTCDRGAPDCHGEPPHGLG
jgi:hypothetical protein